MSSVRSGNSRRRYPNALSTLLGMTRIEEIDGYGILSEDQSDFQVVEERCCRHPEIVPHHHDRLHVLAVALPQSGDKFGVRLTTCRMEPLLKLIQDQENFLTGEQHPTVTNCRQGIDQTSLRRQVRTDLP